jgi:hypothetical protein
MAKLSYLNLTNRVLKRITQATIADVSTATGTALIVTELINEAQNELWTETQWHSLYKTRVWTTEVYTATTISFADAGPDTIDDSASGMGSFQAGQQIKVSGSTSNDGTYTVSTAAAGQLVLQTADALTTEVAGDSVTITALSYPLATDWGRTIDLVDTTNDRMLTEDVLRRFDEDDPDMDRTDDPHWFALEGSQYRLHPVPSTDGIKITERYWKIPTALSANANTSDLPIECENAIIQYALMRILEYQNKIELADRARAEFERHLKRAKAVNSKLIDRLIRMSPDKAADGIHIPKFPASYGVRYF